MPSTKGIRAYDSFKDQKLGLMCISHTMCIFNYCSNFHKQQDMKVAHLGMPTGTEMKMSTVFHLVSRPEAAPAVDRLRQLLGQRAVAAAGFSHRRQTAREVRHRVSAHAQPLHRRTRHLPRLHHLQARSTVCSRSSILCSHGPLNSFQHLQSQPDS